MARTTLELAPLIQTSAPHQRSFNKFIGGRCPPLAGVWFSFPLSLFALNPVGWIESGPSRFDLSFPRATVESWWVVYAPHRRVGVCPLHMI
ncbi:hypothetical protein AVEN_85848-1 [Araneus ventricosus]|uniref:Uncharacterized protein n=1 Tax=Araneus ventricosus TaxID=182803 RepID=A0A4Y2GWT9_ARAVE|nr:hypothetical protein AVEN_85848-1 [Araneus ventricosus]